jgi:hypothetical protein
MGCMSHEPATIALGLPCYRKSTVASSGVRPDSTSFVASRAAYPGRRLIDDDLAFTRDWGFDPRELTVPTYIWHGFR